MNVQITLNEDQIREFLAAELARRTKRPVDMEAIQILESAPNCIVAIVDGVDVPALDGPSVS